MPQNSASIYRLKNHRSKDFQNGAQLKRVIYELSTFKECPVYSRIRLLHRASDPHFNWTPKLKLEYQVLIDAIIIQLQAEEK